jgi:hypothetical protein
MSVVGGSASTGLVARVQNILMKPAAEWDVIANEPATVQGLFTGYAAIVALFPVVGGVIGALAGGLLFHSMFGTTAILVGGIVGAVLGYVLNLAVAFVFSLIVDALASTFNATPNKVEAAKVAVYGFTASWVSGFFSFIPVLGILIALAGFGYSCYLIYLGISKVMKPPADKAVAYAAVAIIINLVIYFIVFWILAIMTAMLMTMMAGAAVTGAAALAQ